ncbi:transglycosylase domain-containing protein [Metabacillus fastidiosus]|uniref:transglycosylase domain-containing protein n=1 Tax=Metabacillus fastidiosus TaxID=1458 RepID=UPI002E2475D8|nr:transglycosylase domain-containing protein [Metabacillus fastidiosus]
MKKSIEKLKHFLPLNKIPTRNIRITYNVFWNLILMFLFVGIIGFCFVVGVGAGYFASLVKDEPVRSYEVMKNEIYNYEETSEVYFANNIYLGKLRTDLDREKTTLDKVSPHLVNAIIATEDELFYEHEGIVPKAIMRAVFQEATNSSTKTGGSTLTQQLIKNQILSNEVSFDRKAKEILLALRLEKFFKKEEILEIYLNVADLGRNASGRNIAGVQTAAQGIFGINAKDLSIPQAAFIAGLPQSPFGYTPFTNSGQVKENLEPGIERMKTVLMRMYKGGYITKEDYEKAITFDLRKSLTTKKPSSIDQYPWLTFEVEDRAKKILMVKLAENDGYLEEDLKKNNDLYKQYSTLADTNLRQNGYRIHTTINKNIYDRMQTVVREYKYYGNDKSETKKDTETGKNITIKEPVEVGAVLIDNKTGKIISFVGGRDHDRSQTNHATNALRPNGSTMKPLLVYAPAMEIGAVQPGTVIADTPFSIKQYNYSPTNYGGAYHGLASARVALQYSYNVPAVKTYYKIMNQNPLSYLEKMGFSSLDKSDIGSPALSLGGMTNGVTVEENVNAFATFANSGKFTDAYMIEKIETSEGKVIYEHKVKQTDVFSPQTAFLTIDMMRDVISKGTAASLNGYMKFHADWAGKTGTGQDYKDAWFVASNPNVTFGTWIGYDKPKPLEVNYKGLSYSKRNIFLWAKLMNTAYDTEPELIAPKERFQMPNGIVKRSYCALTGDLPSPLCEKAGLVASDYFNVKYVPKKVDDSLTSGKFVFVKDRAYAVPPSAPAEFVQEGFIVKRELLQKHNISNLTDLKELLPKTVRWDNLVISDGNEIRDNGAIPSQVQGLTANNGKLSWQANGDNDVIGYRIYSTSGNGGYRKIGSIPSSKSLVFPISGTASSYYVVAVDVAGKESAPSAVITYGNVTEKRPIASEQAQSAKAEQKQPNKQKPENKPVDKKPADAKPETPKPDETKPEQQQDKPQDNGNGEQDNTENNPSLNPI